MMKRCNHGLPKLVVSCFGIEQGLNTLALTKAPRVHFCRDEISIRVGHG